MPISSSATSMPSGPWSQWYEPPTGGSPDAVPTDCSPRYRLGAQPWFPSGQAQSEPRRDGGTSTPRIEHSSSTSVRAVAPHTVSPATSKNHTGNSPPGNPGAPGRSGADHHSSWKAPSATSSLRATSKTRSTSPGLATSVGRASRVASTGVITVLEDTVGMAVSWPTTVTSPGSRPTSSKASRSAPATTPSPPSRRPPGKATSPWWDRNRSDRTVRTTRAAPSSSNSGTSTAAGRPSTTLPATERQGSRGDGSPGRRNRPSASAGRVRSREGAARSSAGIAAQGAVDPGRWRGGRGMDLLVGAEGAWRGFIEGFRLGGGGARRADGG